MKKLLWIILASIFTVNSFGQEKAIKGTTEVRERLLMDFGWKFALGHAYDSKKDFNHATGYFSYFAKAGYGDGPASKDFDDRAWREVDLPHDWCVELPFDSRGSHSHGYYPIGRNFPENSIGWYRKKFFVPELDLGKRISIEFDGVYRNSIVWINGFYLGTEHSGYSSFSYDITDYLNYGDYNVVAVRVDATMEEGWFYEGAGIYRHVWLTKTSPLHIERYGTFVTTDLINNNNNAIIKIRTTVINESNKNSIFNIEEIIVDEKGKIIASGINNQLSLSPSEKKEYVSIYNVTNPKLWSLDSPYLYKLKTVIRVEEKVIDTYETTFGIRTIRFDPNEGFFLNGKHIKILGTNNHQDHAGVGVGIPDALQEFRIKKLKEMGSNAIRTSHNPPTPEFLDACDRLGMLVLAENRLMGVNEEHLKLLENMIKRDRNHPSIILWSLGNEEWAIEGNVKGIRITKTMQDFAQRLDSSRAFTVACSGGWDEGSGTIIQVMGYNYIVLGNIDEHHKKFSWQASVGTEESNTIGTRGIYQTDSIRTYLAPKNLYKDSVGTEYGWKFYVARPFLSGLFFWTGFDYRGEANPFGWPQVTSQYGILDLCGFPKDIFYYLKSWWSNEPVLHIYPHWNWKDKIGQEINVTIYSNCEEVELFLNDKSLGKKAMPVNGHLEWYVKYRPGILSANGYKFGKKILTKKVETTEEPYAVQLIADRNIIIADGEDVSVITVQVNDSKGRLVPIADNEITFSIEGEGKIIGVGNGNPSSHEAEKFFETIKISEIENLKEKAVDNFDNRPEVAFDYDDSNWKEAFKSQSKDWRVYTDSLIVVRGTFDLPEITSNAKVNLFTKSIVENQTIYVNGNLIAANIKRDDPNQSFQLNHNIIKSGRNVYTVIGKRFKKKHQWDEPNKEPGNVQVIYPAPQWKRKVFNGLAQIIIQSTKQQSEIILNASSTGLKSAQIKIKTAEVPLRHAVVD